MSPILVAYTNRKPIFDFLFVINTNLHPISPRFQVIANYRSHLFFAFDGKYGELRLTISMGVNP